MVALTLGCILQLIVAVMAWLVARKRHYHLPFALYITVAALADPLAVACRVYGFAGATAPYEGLPRLYFHIHQALHIAPLIAMAAMALVVFARVRRLEHLWGASAFAFTVLVVTYPTIRCASLGCALVVIHAGYQAVTWAAVGVWVREREWPTLTQAAALVMALGDLALWAGPLATNVFENWGLGYGAQFTALGATLALHALWLRTIRQPVARP